MMPPHPDTVCDLQHLRYQDLLAEAARERRAAESTRGVPRSSPTDACRSALRQVFAWFGTVSVTAPRSRPQASAWR